MGGACSKTGAEKNNCVLGKIYLKDTEYLEYVSTDGDTVIPRLTKIIRSGITFVSRNLR